MNMKIKELERTKGVKRSTSKMFIFGDFEKCLHETNNTSTVTKQTRFKKIYD